MTLKIFLITLIIYQFAAIHCETSNDGYINATFAPRKTYIKPKLGARIIGGEPAGDHQFPWQASITSCDGRWCSICGGSLISPNYVLTAGHCTNGESSFSIGLGSNSRSKPALSVKSNVKIEHPQFNLRALTNDIALIKLPEPVTLNENIQPIGLPSSDSGDFAGQKAIASGYGKTSGGSMASSLQYAELTVISNAQCKRTWPNLFNKAVCTTSSTSNTCSGDSGGPLAVKTDDGYVQVGIMSFVAAGCTNKYPSGYTRVSSYVPWMKEVTGIDG